jgi:hypothetical protein
MASAPKRHAAWASSVRVRPQILTRVRAAATARAGADPPQEAAGVDSAEFMKRAFKAQCLLRQPGSGKQ